MLSACANIALESLSMIECLSVHGVPIGTFTGLRSLTISEFKYNSSFVPMLVPWIGQLRTLESLKISGVKFSSANLEKLVEALKTLPLLSELCVRSAGFRSNAGEPIGSLVALGRVRKLDVSSNHFEDERFSAMVDAILDSPKRRCKLQELNLEDSKIGPAGATKVAELVASSPDLRVLNLTGNPAGDEVAAAFRQGVNSLREFSFRHCDLGGRGVGFLLNTLARASPALNVLRMGENSVGDVGAREVARFVLSSGWRTLVELEMRDSGITETGAMELANAFAKAYTLKSLDMSANSIGPQGTAAVMDALTTASAVPMNMLSFKLCDIMVDGISAVGRLIMRRGCRNLHLCLNRFNDAMVKAIADSVVVSACIIEMLDISANNFGDKGVKYLLDKIMQQHNKLIYELDMSTISISVKGAMVIKLAVEARAVLTKLHLGRIHCDKSVYRIIEEAEMWERSSRPAGTAILELRRGI